MTLLRVDDSSAPALPVLPPPAVLTPPVTPEDELREQQQKQAELEQAKHQAEALQVSSFPPLLNMPTFVLPPGASQINLQPEVNGKSFSSMFKLVGLSEFELVAPAKPANSKATEFGGSLTAIYGSLGKVAANASAKMQQVKLQNPTNFKDDLAYIRAEAQYDLAYSVVQQMNNFIDQWVENEVKQREENRRNDERAAERSAEENSAENKAMARRADAANFARTSAGG